MANIQLTHTDAVVAGQSMSYAILCAALIQVWFALDSAGPGRINAMDSCSLLCVPWLGTGPQRPNYVKCFNCRGTPSASTCHSSYEKWPSAGSYQSRWQARENVFWGGQSVIEDPVVVRNVSWVHGC